VADQDPGEATPASAPAEAEDPLAADRRTLVIGAGAMVALILVGVVSAQLFARGGCADVVEPRPADAVATGAPAEDVVDEHLAPVDGLRAVDILEQVAGAPVEVGIPVGEASEVVVLGDGLLTTGPTVTSVDAGLTPVATFTTDHVVVGDGSAVFDVAVANEQTGQADALVGLRGTDLDVGTCVDTAVVGSPFAFLLGGGEGELLLLRADEDGDNPDLQLRDARAGARWDARLQLPAGPPGTLAERLSAGLGPETVVAARRVGPQEETELPALVSVDRGDGAVQLELGATDLADAAGLDSTGPIRWQVAAVGEGTALVHGRPDLMDAPELASGEVRADGVLLLLDLASGEPLGAVEGVGPLAHAAVDAGDRYAVATETPDNEAETVTLLEAAGAVVDVGPLVADARLAWSGGAVLVAGRDSLTRLAPDAAPSPTILVGGRFVDLTTTSDGRVAALVAARDGGETVLLVTAPVS
jgi:hypothetical protein